MYKLISTDFPYFERLSGPWEQYTHFDCILTADVNHDGIDDIILGSTHKRNPSAFYIQQADGSFEEHWVHDKFQENGAWKNVRSADVNGDGTNDLIVASEYVTNQGSWGVVTVYEGNSRPNKTFSARPYYQRWTRAKITDVETIDVNGDGKVDIYVVRRSREEDTYCSMKRQNVYENFFNNSFRPPKDFVPPSDTASDFLLLNIGGRTRFRRVGVRHSFPGCGVRKYLHSCRSTCFC